MYGGEPEEVGEVAGCVFFNQGKGGGDLVDMGLSDVSWMLGQRVRERKQLRRVDGQREGKHPHQERENFDL
jgi:hypothetical protein